MRLALAVLALGLCPLFAAAEETTVRSEVDARRIGVLDLVQWNLVLEGGNLRLEEDVAVPPLKNLKVVGGPSVSTQVSLVNGRMAQRKVYTWTLKPVAVGPAEVGAVRLKHAGGEATAPAVAVEVAAGHLRPDEPARPTSPFGPDPFGPSPLEEMFGGHRGRAVEGKLFIEAVPSRTRVRVGEAVLVTYYVYARGVQPTDFQSAANPQYPGFWAESIETKESPREEQVRVDGEAFVRFPIHRKLLFPTKAGTLTIPALTLRVSLGRESLFDPGVSVTRSTKAVQLEVEPLPGAAADFAGAVGRFKATATAEPPSLRLGEAATVRFRVEGVGNLKWVDRGPELVVEGARVFAPQVKSDLTARADGLSGTKTWEYVVVPETSGRLQVPALPFSYFDPAEGRVVKAETAPLALEVAGGAPASGAAAPLSAPSSRARSALARRDALDPPRQLVGAVEPVALGYLLVVVGLLHGGLFLLGRARLSLGSAAVRGQGRAALRHLDKAREAGIAKEEAAALIEQALHEAFAERDGNPERERVVSGLIEEVHLVRYAPQLGDYSEKVGDLARRAREAVERWA
ncbi:MAG TPA: BatD family protein [Vicinamibacteria bacterium]|nr:BatD family protein [Vicinamibacteria bacterium]